MPSGPEPAAAKRGWMAPAIALMTMVIAMTALLVVLADATRERIARNQQSWIVAALQALMPAGSYDNDLLADTVAVTSPELLGTTNPVTIYRARRNGRPDWAEWIETGRVRLP